MTTPGLLAIRLAELQAAKDRDLYRETSSFLKWIFQDVAIRPATLRLRRTERPALDRFFDEQRKVLLDVAGLLGDFLETYPHPQNAGLYRCGSPQCDERLVKLQELLKGEISDLDGRGATPARDAVECLRGCFTAHVYAASPRDGSALTVRLDERLASLWLGHATQCWQRAERLQISPVRSMDVLLRWTMGEATVSISDAREHISRVGRALATIAQGLESTAGVIESFRMVCEQHDRPSLESIAENRGGPVVADVVTARAERFLWARGLPAWSFAGRRRPSPELGSLAIDTVAYGEDEPCTQILDGVRRFHDRLGGSDEIVDEGVLFVLRVGGPRCELPNRLEFERFAMTLAPIDLAQARQSNPQSIRVGAEEILDTVCQGDSHRVPTLRSIELDRHTDPTPPLSPRRRAPLRLRFGTSTRFPLLLCPQKS